MASGRRTSGEMSTHMHGQLDDHACADNSMNMYACTDNQMSMHARTT